MLGGSFSAALLRNSLGAALVMSVFLLLDLPRFPMRKTVACYIVFGLFASVVFSVWYLLSSVSYIRFSGIATIPTVGIFCFLLSTDRLYLSIYKLTLGCYLLSVTVVCGVDISRLWFGGSIRTDIALRIALVVIFLYAIVRNVRPQFMAGREFLCETMDLPSIVTLVVLVMSSVMAAYRTDSHPFSVDRVIYIATLLTMAGIIQWLVFHMYLYRGWEYCSRMEKELLEMTGLLLHRQVEQMKRKEAAAQNERRICANPAVNGILNVYESYAGQESIKAELSAEVSEEIGVREQDLASILVGVFENAIRECRLVEENKRWIRVSIVHNRNKIVIKAAHASAQEGAPGYFEDREERAACIRRVIAFYHGEVSCAAGDGEMVLRILLNARVGG